jgi:hypothetical protein
MRQKERRRLQPRVKLELARQLTAYCAATNTTATAVIEEALATYLNKTGDHTVLMRRLDAIGRRLERTDRDIQMVAETIGAFVHIWYAYTPELPDDAKLGAQRQGNRRFDAFVHSVSLRLGKGQPFLDDLAKDALFTANDQASQDLQAEPNDLAADELFAVDDEALVDLQPQPRRQA